MKYIDEIKVSAKLLEKFADRRLVCIDPNKDDLIYCLSKRQTIGECLNNSSDEYNEDDIMTFRYTQNQRRKEMGIKVHKKKLSKLKEKYRMDLKTLDESLTATNSKSCFLARFSEYLKQKVYVFNRIKYFYKMKPHRKFKFDRYRNTQKSEAKMIKNFINKFGRQNDCVIIYGDHSGSGIIKGKEPTVNKRIREIFLRNKFKVYSIDEFRTSKLCNSCENECENFIYRPSKKPKIIKRCAEKGVVNSRLVWGLVRCKNVNCKLYHNRDKNATLNMYKISMSYLRKLGRPERYKR